MSAIAVGKKLVEMGLKGADKQPTERALSEGFCRSTPLKKTGTPFFLWNKNKVAELLRSSGLQQLDSAEAEAYETARALIAAAKEAAETGMDKLFFFMVDEVPPAQHVSVNRWLGKLGSEIKLGE